MFNPVALFPMGEKLEHCRVGHLTTNLHQPPGKTNNRQVGNSSRFRIYPKHEKRLGFGMLSLTDDQSGINTFHRRIG